MDNQFGRYKCPLCGQDGVRDDLTYDLGYPIRKLQGKPHQCDNTTTELIKKNFDTFQRAAGEFKSLNKLEV